MYKIFKIMMISLFTGNFFYVNAQNDPIQKDSLDLMQNDSLNVKIHGDSSVYPIIKTFLGNWQRNYYGENPPNKLDLVWKHYLGKGETVISRKIGTKEWAGAGWTGQPLLVREKNNLFIIQGAYDHHLKKIDAETGELIWQYKFDDVVKGTGTIWVNNTVNNSENELIILQGSRLGTGHYLDAKYIPSYRAISYHSGKELWRMDQKWTHSYSRDVDGSALILNDTAYIGLENSLFTVFSPDYRNATMKDGMLQPEIYQEIKLYTMDDVYRHKHNVVTESSPALLKNRIYVASGSGHVFGYNLKSRKIDWDFYIGSDMDGSTVVTSDCCILVSVEKQYIKGQGGIFKLNPEENPQNAVVWYFPTQNNDFAGWEGGVIGSAGINDHYVRKNNSHLAAFVGIDEYLYVVNHQQIDSSIKVLGPDSLTIYNTPKLIFKYHT
ncbi:MAG TPA: PQQ-binding-like beta-propeller repeat protein, partial [Bacteroidales bacterium]|nr:PQQ-binding-like beta-propeller repeat protein [Bacteroidales bacterium]